MLLKVVRLKQESIVSFAYIQIHILLKDVSNFKYINQRFAYMQIYILLKVFSSKHEGG